MARQGKAGLGEVRLGSLWLDNQTNAEWRGMARQGWAWPGEEWLGEARHGTARLGAARQGKAPNGRGSKT